jgi:hypothetical protein
VETGAQGPLLIWVGILGRILGIQWRYDKTVLKEKAANTGMRGFGGQHSPSRAYLYVANHPQRRVTGMNENLEGIYPCKQTHHSLSSALQE